MRGVNTKSKSRLKKLVIFFLLLAVLLLLGNSVRRVYMKKKGAEEALARMNAEIQELKARQESLEQFEKRVQTSEGVEFELRKKFNVALEGEKVAILVDETASSSQRSTNESVWHKFKNFVINLWQ